MDMTLETLIYNNYKSLNDNDKYIWNFILNNKKKCESMSIQELANSCNVSHTTILRFAQKIGLNGYSELKFYLKLDNKSKKEPVFDKQEYKKIHDDINKTMDTVIEKNLEKVCKLLDSCNKIYAYATGELQNNAIKELKRALLSIGKLANIIEGKDELSIISKYVQEDDVIFIYSMSGENERSNDFAKILKEKGVKIISVTRNGNSTLSKLSDISIEFYTHETIRLNKHVSIEAGAQFFIINELLIMKYLEYKYSK